MRAIIIGIIAAFFFAFTFVINQLMSDLGGDWMWSASLRYFFMVPFLLLLVLFKSGFKKMWSEIKKTTLCLVHLQPNWVWSFLCTIMLCC
ncbi:hypothetical protein BTHER_01535 [Brochothrix thermosphacta DSM 20171 = FSL F6-1036]|nr:hypothetical protein BTHER_01535 [Brochothrix thermosphacta DSM 20171 = FSL F6-1036]